MRPLEVNVSLPEDATWVNEHLLGRWLSRRHYQLYVGGDGINWPALIRAQRQPICLYLPNVLSQSLLDDVYPVLRDVARRRAWSTKRIRSVGNIPNHRNRDGTWSRDPRALRFDHLRGAREGTFGWRGREACAFNVHYPDKYLHLVALTEVVADLFRDHWPEAYERQMLLASRRPEYLIGRTPWSQAVCNVNWWMSAHTDAGNFPGSLSAEIVLGDFRGGRLILPRSSLGIAIAPGDLLLFDGREAHAVERFEGERLSTVWYLRPTNSIR